MSLNPRNLKLIYSYLACLILLICILINIPQVVDSTIKIIFFESRYIPNSELSIKNFLNKEKSVNINSENFEKLRQQAIVEDKQKSEKSMRNDVAMRGSYIVTYLIILLIHCFIIFRTNRD